MQLNVTIVEQLLLGTAERKQPSATRIESFIRAYLVPVLSRSVRSRRMPNPLNLAHSLSFSSKCLGLSNDLGTSGDKAHWTFGRTGTVVSRRGAEAPLGAIIIGAGD